MTRSSVLKPKPSFIAIAQERDNLTPFSPDDEPRCYSRKGLKHAVSARDLKTRASSWGINQTWRSDGTPPSFERHSSASSTGVKSGRSLGTLNTLVSWLRDPKKTNMKSSRSILDLNTVRHSTEAEEMSSSNRRRSETIHMIKSSTMGSKNRHSRSHRLNASFQTNQTPPLDDKEMRSSPLIMKSQQRMISIHDEIPKTESPSNRIDSVIPARYSLEVHEEEDGDDHSSFHTIDGRDEETHNKDGFCLPKWPGASHRWSTASHTIKVVDQWGVDVGADEVLLPAREIEDNQANASTSTR